MEIFLISLRVVHKSLKLKSHKLFILLLFFYSLIYNNIESITFENTFSSLFVYFLKNT